MEIKKDAMALALAAIDTQDFSLSKQSNNFDAQYPAKSYIHVTFPFQISPHKY